MPAVNAEMSSVDLSRLQERWRRAPRRWGHPIHSLCSYFAMFPPQLASVFIQWLTNPGDAVFDPFSGRGTVALEAVLSGRVGLGSDANPLAVSLTRAKVRIPSSGSVSSRVRDLRSRYKPGRTQDVPDHIAMLYTRRTLAQLVYLRGELDATKPTDAFLIAMVLGLLHGNHSRAGATRAFSVSMPNTFAMAPGYVRKYIEQEQLVAPEVDVFTMLEARAERLGLPSRRIEGGKAWLQDATKEPPGWLKERAPRLVLTSPPYLQVIKYGKYNWVRLWFLGHDPKVVDQGLVDTASLGRYREFLTTTLSGVSKVVQPDGYVCLVIGDVRRETGTINLAEDVWQTVAKPAGWQLLGVVRDRVPERHKVSRIWTGNPGRATKTDRILILSKEASSLPVMKRMNWHRPTAVDTGGVG